MDEKRKFWVALNLVPGVGKATYRKLVERFGGAEGVFKAQRAELREIPGLPDKTMDEILNFSSRARLEREVKLIEDRQVAIITMWDSAYPHNLKHIPDPPPLLYVEGEIKEEDALAISIVGTRSPTWYGREITSRLSEGLARRGVTVVSGMARGIDSHAHLAALDAGGRSIAVLGCGLNVVYPPENKELKERIKGQGAVISEFVMDAKPDKLNFPIRNRIISGLSLGTVVVEAPLKSGALITATLALEQNREIFAVPGSVSSHKSRGTNSLIKQGAKLVEKVEDIIEELPAEVGSLLKEPVAVKKPPPPQLPPEELKVFSLLHYEAQHIDSLTEQSGLPPGKMAGILARLELEGLIKQFPGKTFIRSR